MDDVKQKKDKNIFTENEFSILDFITASILYIPIFWLAIVWPLINYFSNGVKYSDSFNMPFFIIFFIVALPSMLIFEAKPGDKISHIDQITIKFVHFYINFWKIIFIPLAIILGLFWVSGSLQKLNTINIVIILLILIAFLLYLIYLKLR